MSANTENGCPDSHILLLGLLPRGESATDPVRVKISTINQKLTKLNDGKSITFIDVAPKFLNPDGTIAKMTMDDFAHLNAKSFEILSGLIQPIIDRYCPKDGPPVAVNSDYVPTTPLNSVYPPAPLPPGGNPTLVPVPHFDWFQKFLGNRDRLKQIGKCDLVFRWRLDHRFLAVHRQGCVAAALRRAQGGRLRNQRGPDPVCALALAARPMDGQDPKLIVLMIGTNNIGQKPEGRRRRYSSHYRRI